VTAPLPLRAPLRNRRPRHFLVPRSRIGHGAAITPCEFPDGEAKTGKLLREKRNGKNATGKRIIGRRPEEITINYLQMLGAVTSPTSVRSIMELDDRILTEECRVAHTVLWDEEKAVRVVARAASRLPFCAAQQLDNRRRRYQPIRKGRESYRPLTGKRELLRFLVLAGLDEAEVEEERAGRLLGPADQIRCYVKQIVKTVLKYNSFYGAVAAANILCDFSAQETLEMYDLVAKSRARAKDWAACSRVRTAFLRIIEKRFGNRAQLRKEGNSYRLNWRRATADEVELVKRTLTQLLPPLSPPPAPTRANAFLERISPFLEESFREINSIHRFLDPAQFQELAAEVTGSRAAGLFEARLRVLDTGQHSGPNPGSRLQEHAGRNDFDLERLRNLIVRYKERGRRVAPGWLSIQVDSIDRAVIDDPQRTDPSRNSQSLSFREKVGNIIARLEYRRILLCNAFCYDGEDGQRESAIASARARYRMLRKRSAADKVEEIDALVSGQAITLCEFLDQARVLGIPGEPAPKIHEPHTRLSRILGTLAMLTGVCNGIGLWFFADEPLAVLLITTASLAAIVAAKWWWRYGLTLRLYRRYHEAEHAIALLQADVERSVAMHGAPTQSTRDQPNRRWER